jgi:hypothetical protein
MNKNENHIFKINEKAKYINLDGTTQIVTILNVYLDTLPLIYYTIQYDTNKTKQTISDRLLYIEKDMGFFKINDKAEYVNSNGTYDIVTLMDVHLDKYPILYYSVKFNNGKIKRVKYDKLFMKSSN